MIAYRKNLYHAQKLQKGPIKKALSLEAIPLAIKFG